MQSWEWGSPLQPGKHCGEIQGGSGPNHSPAESSLDPIAGGAHHTRVGMGKNHERDPTRAWISTVRNIAFIFSGIITNTIWNKQKDFKVIMGRGGMAIWTSVTRGALYRYSVCYGISTGAVFSISLIPQHCCGIKSLSIVWTCCSM